MKWLIMVNPERWLAKSVPIPYEEYQKIILICQYSIEEALISAKQPEIIVTDETDDALYEILVKNSNSSQCDIFIYQSEEATVIPQNYDELFRAGIVCCVETEDVLPSHVLIRSYIPTPLVVLCWNSLRFLDLRLLPRSKGLSLLDKLSYQLDSLGFSTYLLSCQNPQGQYFNLGDFLISQQIYDPCLVNLDNLHYLHVIRQGSISEATDNLSLLIDLSHLRYGGYNGTMEYGRELFQGILRQQSKFPFTKIKILGQPEALTFHNISLNYLLTKNDNSVFDICFRPYQVEDTLDNFFQLLFRSKRVVITQLDVIGSRCHYINNDYRRLLESLCLQASDGVLYISEYAKRDIETFYNLQSLTKGKAIHLGMPTDKKSFQKNHDNVGTGLSFLVVGNSKYDHKMLRPTLDVIRSFLDKYSKDIKFIFLGDLSVYEPLPEAITFYQHNVSQSDLEDIFQTVNGFIYPSVYEGFGLPILHAKRYHKRILVADYPINREMAERFGQADLFYYQSIADLENKLKEFVEIETTPRVTGIRRTWDDVAHESLTYLHQTCQTTQTQVKRQVIDSIFLAWMPKSSHLSPQVNKKIAIPRRYITSRQPRVSVILTSYNYEQYVSESIKSVFNQTYKDLELIIVDDGSRDNSQVVIEETIKEANIPVQAIYKANGGQANALNTGYQYASGEILAFLDSDDIWYEDKIEKMIDFINMCPGGAVYQHQMDTGKGQKQKLVKSGNFFGVWQSIGTINLAEHQGLISPFQPTSGLMIPKQILDKVFPLPEELTTCPDGYITRTSCVYGSLYSFPMPLGLWRDHDQNAGKQTEYGYEEFWLTTLKPAINKYYQDHNIPVKLVHHPILPPSRLSPRASIPKTDNIEILFDRVRTIYHRLIPIETRLFLRDIRVKLIKR